MREDRRSERFAPRVEASLLRTEEGCVYSHSVVYESNSLEAVSWAIECVVGAIAPRPLQCLALAIIHNFTDDRIEREPDEQQLAEALLTAAEAYCDRWEKTDAANLRAARAALSK